MFTNIKPLFLSHTHKHNVCQAERKETPALKAKQCFQRSLLLKGKLGVPSQITRAVSKCKYVIKSTKQLKMQIERSAPCCSFSICWEEKKSNISIKALPCASSAERTDLYVLVCEASVFEKSSQGTWAFSWRRGNSLCV